METGASKLNNSLVHDITYRMCEVRRIVITYISLPNFTFFTLMAAFQITFLFCINYMLFFPPWRYNPHRGLYFTAL